MFSFLIISDVGLVTSALRSTSSPTTTGLPCTGSSRSSAQRSGPFLGLVEPCNTIWWWYQKAFEVSFLQNEFLMKLFTEAFWTDLDRFFFDRNSVCQKFCCNQFTDSNFFAGHRQVSVRGGVPPRRGARWLLSPHFHTIYQRYEGVKTQLRLSTNELIYDFQAVATAKTHQEKISRLNLRAPSSNEKGVKS